MKNRDLLAVRAFVTAKDECNYENVHDDTVIVDSITHSNLQQRHVEIRLSKSDAMSTLRRKIHLQTGTGPAHQHLQIYSGSGQLCHDLPPSSAAVYDAYPIGYFLPHHGWRVHCIDTNPLSLSAGRALEDVTLVTKFRLTDAEYDAKTSKTLRQWKKEQLQRDPTFTLQKHAAQHAALQHARYCHQRHLPLPLGYKVVRDSNEEDENATTVVWDATITASAADEDVGPSSVQHCTVGERCQIVVGQRRGVVAWKGTFAVDPSHPPPRNSRHDAGYWVGIRLDEPVGKNSGNFRHVPYFDADPNCGAFVRGSQVQIGDFPVRDLWDDDSDDDEL